SPLLTRPTAAPPQQELAHGVNPGPTIPFATDTTAPQSVNEYTIGATSTVAGGDRWTHSFVAGIDGYRLSNVETNLTPIPNVVDSALRAAQGGADRATLRASSVLHLRATDATRATLTFSAEHATLRERSVSSWRFAADGRNTVSRLAPSELVNWENNTGVL